MRDALAETADFIRLFMHWAGRSEIPPQYLLWSCISLIAATVADRVYLVKMRDRPLAPNLYTFLIGDGASGKNEAILMALKFVQEIAGVNAWDARTTAQRLMDKLGRKVYNPETKQKEEPNPKIWVISTELAQSVGTGERAKDLIHLMTEFYSHGRARHEGTRLHGEIVIKDACVNWIVGTQHGWLRAVITPEIYESGFPARVVFVPGETDTSKRIWRPQYPKDACCVAEHLQARIKALTYLAGEFKLTPAAMEHERQWYEGREAPEDKSLVPMWRRHHDLLLKLCMVLALSDGADLVINETHVKRAKKLVAEAERGYKEVFQYMMLTKETTHIKVVSDILSKRKHCTGAALTQATYHKGMNGKQTVEAATSLVQMGRVARMPRPKGGIEYVWVERGKGMTEVEPDGLA